MAVLTGGEIDWFDSADWFELKDYKGSPRFCGLNEWTPQITAPVITHSFNRVLLLLLVDPPPPSVVGQCIKLMK